MPCVGPLVIDSRLNPEPRLPLARQHAILLTGMPGIGKTTIIRRVAESLCDRRLGGFVTDEIRRGHDRVGFRLKTFQGQSAVLAHVELAGPQRVGRYGVDVAALDTVVEAALDPKAAVELFLVDEIGKMECLSAKFVAAMVRLLDAHKPLVATIASRGGGFIEGVKHRSDVDLLEVTRTNRDGMPTRLLHVLRSVP